MRFYGKIEKIDRELREVSGYASTEALDAHGEIVLRSAVEDALDDYMEFANIREMHQLSAVGKALEATLDDRGLYLVAKVVDDAAWEKVTSGVYAGYSIGGRVLARDPKDKKIVTKIRLDEISLVDRPSNPESKFDLWRAAGLADRQSSFDRNIAAVDEMLAKTETALARLQDDTSRMEKWIRGPDLKKAGLERMVAHAVKQEMEIIKTFMIPPTSFTITRDDAGAFVVEFFE